MASRILRLGKGAQVLTSIAKKWLSLQPIKVACDRQQAPALWVQSILEKVREGSDGEVEQQLVGATLQRRHPEINVEIHPRNAADEQARATSDFPFQRVCYHVTVNMSQGAIKRCEETLASGVHPVLLLPKRFVEKASLYAEVAGIQDRISILSIEHFITQNIIEMSTQGRQDFFATLKAIIEEYNRRLEEVETDMSLRIEIC